jgi:hypothetical protein
MSGTFSTLLDQCLEAIQAGRATPDSCARSHPDDAGNLLPLLQLASHSHNMLSPEQPNPEFVRAARGRLLAAQKRVRPRERPRLNLKWPVAASGFRLAYAWVALLLVLALLGSGVGVVRASADSLPGDGFYGLKLAAERIQLVISLSPDRDAELLVGFAGERLAEAEQLIDLERYEDLDGALSGLDEVLTSLATLETDGTIGDGSLGQIESRLEKHLGVLQQVLEKVPEQAKGAILSAIERSNHSQEVILKVKGDDHPSNSAPGQLKRNEGAGTPEHGNGQDKDKPKKTEKSK